MVTLATRMATLETTGTAEALAETEMAWIRPKLSTRAGSKGSVFLSLISPTVLCSRDLYDKEDGIYYSGCGFILNTTERR